MRYKIFDAQLKNYLEDYDEKGYWTLEEAQNLAYRRQEERCEREDDEYKEEALEYLDSISKMETEAEISRVLAVFDYALERMKD